MTDLKFRKAVRTCFYHYKKLLCLPPQWKIRIGINEKLKCFAEVDYNYDTKQFNVWVNPKLNQDLETLKDSILHECFHIFFSPMTAKFDLLMEEIRNKRKINYKVTKSKALKWEEYFIDKLTKLICQLEKEQD
jgi:hypothetical protein